MPTDAMRCEHRGRRLFGVVPAAGRSRRMGRPKLLLEADGVTVIERLLRTLQRADLTATVVVVRADDAALAQRVVSSGGILVQPPEPPPDMRSSVVLGLRAIGERFQPGETDGWLLVPADHPLLPVRVLDRLVERWRTTTADVLVPTFEGRRGHPTIFRWSLLRAIEQIPPDCGLNWLLERFADSVEQLPVNDSDILFDLDTPADWAAFLQRSNGGADDGSPEV